ncbi:MAG: hypothetical protein V1837_02345 [Candidatus Woesearchaeota archaeon]
MSTYTPRDLLNFVRASYQELAVGHSNQIVAVVDSAEMHILYGKNYDEVMTKLLQTPTSDRQANVVITKLPASIDQKVLEE